MATSVVDYKFIARPNRSLSPRGMAYVVLLLAAISLSIATAFGLAGAWMVFPFAGLELLGLAYAFYLLHCHAGDYESITISGDHLAVEKRDYKNVCQVEFHRYWAQIVLRETPAGEQRLWLRSHGKEIEFGRYISSQQRLDLARELKRQIGAGH